MKKIILAISLVCVCSFVMAQQDEVTFTRAPREVAIPADAVRVAFAQADKAISQLNYPQNENETDTVEAIFDALLPAINQYNDVRKQYLSAAQVAGTLVATTRFSAKNKTFYVQDLIEKFGAFMPTEKAEKLAAFRSAILDDQLVIKTEKPALLNAYLNTYAQAPQDVWGIERAGN